MAKTAVFRVFVIFEYPKGVRMAEKELKFYINSVIENIGDDEPSTESERFAVLGKFTHKDGETTLSYRETSRSGDVLCTITAKRNGIVTVSRRGACVCDMVFEEGKTHKSLYSVPPFSFDMCITAERTRLDFSDDGGTLILIYRMNIGGQDKSVKFKIRA